MSILIKGVEMPKDCNECLIVCEHSGLYIGTVDKRSKDCPLLEIPTPHGRLIDADWLMWNMGLDEVVKYGNKTVDQREFSYGTLMRYEIADAINDAPTIIPAEEGE